MKDTWRDIFSLEYLGACFLIFGIPVILVLLADWNPFLGLNSDRYPISLNDLLLPFSWWICLFLLHKYKSERDELKQKVTEFKN